MAAAVVFVASAGTWLVRLPANIDRQDGSWEGRILFGVALLSLLVLVTACGAAIGRRFDKRSYRGP